MMTSVVSVIGELIGVRRASDPDGRGEVVMQVTSHGGPDGPAQNSLILVDLDHDGMPLARYLSSIGYPDLERGERLRVRAMEARRAAPVDGHRRRLAALRLGSNGSGLDPALDPPFRLTLDVLGVAAVTWCGACCCR